jgi:hypothetical protein
LEIVESDRLQVTIWHMRIARWIPRSIDIHSEYVILIAFLLQQWLQERAKLLRYTNVASLVLIVYMSDEQLFYPRGANFEV